MVPQNSAEDAIRTAGAATPTLQKEEVNRSLKSSSSSSKNSIRRRVVVSKEAESNMLTPGGGAGIHEFDALRREATRLERHLEEKVAKYQQLAQRLTMGNADHHHDVGFHHSAYANTAHFNSSSLLDSAEIGGVVSMKPSASDQHSDASSLQHLATDITRTISSMSDLIKNKMAPAAERTGKAQHALLVKRYREILYDASTDFQKTSAAVSRRREALELFRGANVDGNGNGDERDEAMEHLLRERNAIGNSLKSATSVLGQAAEIRSDLRTQGQSLRNVTNGLTTMAGHVPGLNRLIDGIRRKRGRDDFIVSLVIAGCILFTLWYIFVA